MKRVYDFLKKANVYYLATVEGDQPRVRPFGTVNEFEGKLYIQTGKSKPCYQQMIANPKVEICAFAAGEWLRLAATVTVQPKSVTVGKGETAKISFTAVGDDLKYEWYYKNPGATKFSKTSTFTGNTYTISSKESLQLQNILTIRNSFISEQTEVMEFFLIIHLIMHQWESLV